MLNTLFAHPSIVTDLKHDCGGHLSPCRDTAQAVERRDLYVNYS